MAKFSAGMSVSDQGVAEGREGWSGELPPTGSYSGVLKILSTGVIGATAKNAGKAKLSVGVELRNTPEGKYDGYIAWGNLNLIEASAPFINQFLIALTDGSEKQFQAIQKGFETGMETDERKKHIIKIGRWNIGSPEGELPIKVSISNKPFHNKATGTTTQQVRIESFLLGAGSGPAGGNGSAGPEEVVEDEVSVDLEPEDDDEDADSLLS